MKSRAGLAVVLCFVLLGSYVYAQFGTKPSELSTIKVRDDLFVFYNDLVPGNTTVLVTNQGLILVDNKFEIDFDNLMAQIRKISISRSATSSTRTITAITAAGTRRCRRRTSRSWPRSGRGGKWSKPTSPARRM